MRPSTSFVPLAGLAIFAIGASARASAKVDAAGCPGLDAAEVARLLDLEVSTMHPDAEPAPSFALALLCEGGVMRMSLVDPTTSKRLERSIPAPAAGPGYERVVALTASQLLVASWLELLAKPRSAEAPTPVPAPKPAGVARRIAAQSLPPRELSSPAAIGLDGGIMWRDTGAPMWLSAAGAFSTVGVSRHWSARLEASLEHGTAGRDTGDVSVWVTSIGVGAGWRTPMGRSAEWRIDGLAGPALVQLNGKASSAAFVGKTATAISAQAWLRSGPCVGAGPFELSLSAAGGWLLVAPRGGVAEDRPVDIRGAYWGVLAGVGWGSEP